MYNLIKLENNDIKISNKILEFKSPKNIYIPILTNSTFKLNEYVYKNTYFGNYITSISGYIKDIKQIKLNNKQVSSIIIDNDYKENIKKKNNYKKVSSKEELLELLNNYKLDDIYNKINNQSIINNLVISSIDEEEYSIKEYITLSNYYSEILETIDSLCNIFNKEKSIITTKNTDFNSIKNVKSVLGTYPNIEVVLVPDKYLISYKPFLCSYLNKEENDTLILSTSDIYNIYKCINNKIIDDNIITISGNAIKKSMVVNARLYISLKELLDEFVNYNTSEYEIFLNGYVGGKKVKNIDNIIITRDINVIIINKKEDLLETNCINCGACMKVCPKNINVKRCYFNKLTNKNCISCGLCNYVCPAYLKLREIVEGNNE